MRKIIHFIYHAIWLMAFKLKNIILNTIFKTKLYLNNVKFGKGVKCINCIPALHIHHKCGNVMIGNNVLMRSKADVCWNSKIDITVKKNATLQIGNNSGISGSIIYCTEKIEIGNNVMIGGGCRIFDTNFHPIEAAKRHNSKTVNDGNRAPVIIEDDVFIGTNCIIGKGVRIGQGSVIAAGSVVVKPVPTNEIW